VKGKHGDNYWEKDSPPTTRETPAATIANRAITAKMMAKATGNQNQMLSLWPEGRLRLRDSRAASSVVMGLGLPFCHKRGGHGHAKHGD